MPEKTISCINSSRGCKVIFTTLRSMQIHSKSMRCIGSAIFNEIRRFKKVCWVCSKPYDRKYFERHVCIQSKDRQVPNRNVIRETPAKIVINTSRNVVIVNGRHPADRSNMRRWARGPKREENRYFRETARVVSMSERVRERERYRDHNRERHRDNRIVSYRRERGQRHDLRNVLVEKRNRSDSLSLGQELPRENAPPLRLIDDLFQKIMAQPCTYWLPQTPEQIAFREATRQKQLAEQRTNASEVGRVERAFSRWGP